MDTTNQWPQGICLVKPLHHEASKSASGLAALGGGGGGGGGVVERKARPQKEQALNCPRCNSTNTKFCYYNNYSLSQPRYFCKTCRRYWTEGGTLRNVPVGGGSRKNKRSSSTPTSSSPNKKVPDLTTIFSSHQNPNYNNNNKIHLLQGQDLNLPHHHNNPTLGVDGFLHHFPFTTDTTRKTLLDSTNLPAALEFLKAAGVSSSSSTSLISSLSLMPPLPPVSDPNNSIFYYHHHHQDNGYREEEQAGGQGVVQDTSSSGRRLFLPYEELKPVSTATDHQGESNGYWNGMLGGGGSTSW